MKHMEIFTGRVGQIRELKELGGEKNNCVISFSVAETPRVKNKQTQQWEDGVTIWTDVTVFGDEARNFQRSFKPGNFVTVVGARSAREYTPKDSTEKRVVQTVLAEQISAAITKFHFIEGIGSVGKGGSAGSGAPAQSQAAPQQTAVNEDPFASSDPFGGGSAGGASNDDPFASNENPFGGADDNPFKL